MILTQKKYVSEHQLIRAFHLGFHLSLFGTQVLIYSIMN